MNRQTSQKPAICTHSSYCAKKWVKQIQLANNAFAEGRIEQATHLYKIALTISKQAFINHRYTNSFPGSLTPAMIVSYMDLANCWAAQGKKREQVCCLTEIYDFLKESLSDLLISDVLRQQLYTGLGKVFLELRKCFEEMGETQMNQAMGKDFSQQLPPLSGIQKSVAFH